MCVVCGCDDPVATDALVADRAQGLLHFGEGVARVSVPGMDAVRTQIGRASCRETV